MTDFTVEHLIEGIPDAVLVADREGRILLVNRPAERLFRLGRGDLASKLIHQLLPALHSRVLGVSHSLMARRGDGMEIPVEATLGTVGPPDRGLVMAVVRDVGARDRLERQVAILHAVTLAVNGALDVNAALGGTLREVCAAFGWVVGQAWLPSATRPCLECAPAWYAAEDGFERFREESLGLGLAFGQGLPGRAWSDARPSWTDDLARLADAPLARVAAEAGLRGGLAVPILADRGVVAVLEFLGREARPIDEETLRLTTALGNQVGQFLVRKRAELALRESEERLRQSQKMEAVGRLAGGVAHDFNNLLTVIGGYGEMLHERLVDAPELQALAQEIRDAGARGAALTRQLLSFSRKQVVRPRVLDLDLLIAGITRMLARLVGEEIELATSRGAGEAGIFADPGQVEQVLINLVVNARDAIRGGGRITVETGWAEIAAGEESERRGLPPGRYVTLTVLDTGSGMDEVTMAHLFEPFFTTKEKGTGLGLPTVYGIVKDAGGRVDVESVPGKGSLFRVLWPRAQGDAAPRPGSEPSVILPRGGETILFAEDADVVRRMGQAILEGLGYRVLAASDGGEALRLAERHPGPISLLVTDAVMPKLQGTELAERLCRLRPGTRVLYISGYADSRLRESGLSRPEVHLLTKPFTPSLLARKVREVLDGPAPA